MIIKCPKQLQKKKKKTSVFVCKQFFLQFFTGKIDGAARTKVRHRSFTIGCTERINSKKMILDSRHYVFKIPALVC